MAIQIDNIVDRKTHTPSRSWPQRFLSLGLIVVILAAGFFVARHLIQSTPKAKRKAPKKMETLVETVRLSPASMNVTIKAFGQVMPAKEVDLMARVNGEVIDTHPQLFPGGIIEAGETVVRLDDTDYRLALRRKQNALAKAKADLRIEQGRQSVAEREWTVINELSGEIDQSNEDLALRQPQLAQVESVIDVAEADIAKAELDLTRTGIKAPFRAVVRKKNVSLGSIVSTQTVIATLLGVESFWAELSIPMQQVSWLTMPGQGKKGAAIKVHSSEKINYTGRMIRMLPDLDPDGLMARVLIEIDDPMGLTNGNPPLPIGSFVNAEITGKKIANCCRIPRHALRDGNKVFVASDDDVLRITPVSVLWSDAEWAFVKGGKAKLGSRVIVSKVAAPIEGMRLKVISPVKEN